MVFHEVAVSLLVGGAETFKLTLMVIVSKRFQHHIDTGLRVSTPHSMLAIESLLLPFHVGLITGSLKHSSWFLPE
jgi:hypothetical protein